MGRRKKAVASTDSESDTSIDPDELNSEQKIVFSLFEQKLNAVVMDFKSIISAKDTMMDQMSAEISILRNKVMSLEDKLEDTEAYERRDTVIFSGSELPAVTDDEDCSKVITELLKDKVNYFLRQSEISVAHRLGQKTESQTPDKRKIIVKLCRRDIKNDIMKACRTIKPKNLYANESLTRVRSTALYGLRQAKLKYPNIIAGCGSSEGRVYAWIKPPRPNAPNAKNTRIMINSMERFMEFCTGTLKCNHSDLVTNWPNN